MPARWLLLVLSCFVLVQAQASRCLLSEALQDPELSGNARFWEEYAALNQRYDGSVPDGKIEELMAKHAPAVSQATAPVKATATAVTLDRQPSKRLNVQSKAQKELDALPAHLREKFDEFMDIALRDGGLSGLRKNPGSWNLEKMPEFGNHAFSVRLSSGYRVLFDVRDGEIVVRRINKGQIHRN